jgi:hypothetical protein
VSVTARLTRFEPSEPRNFESTLPPLTRTVEFLVETDAPIPVRALSPVLYVGDVPVTEVLVDDDTHYRFVALQPRSLRPGAPVTLGWSGEPPSTRVDTGTSFVAPEGMWDDPA